MHLSTGVQMSPNRRELRTASQIKVGVDIEMFVGREGLEVE